MFRHNVEGLCPKIEIMEQKKIFIRSVGRREQEISHLFESFCIAGKSDALTFGPNPKLIASTRHLADV
jgi:hypothetical protein